MQHCMQKLGSGQQYCYLLLGSACCGLSGCKLSILAMLAVLTHGYGHRVEP